MAGPMSGLALFAWDDLTRNGPGPGVANSHTATAKDVEEYFQRDYGESPELLLPHGLSDTYPGDSYGRISYLVSDEGSIHYTAAYLRMLADYRKGANGEPDLRPHLDDISYADMTVVNGAFRTGIEGGWGDVEAFQNAALGTTYGPLILAYAGLYR